MESLTIKGTNILNLLRQLPPQERLKIIAQALPETDYELSHAKEPKQSVWGLWADLGSAPDADEIDELRREIWANFPREDI